MSTLPCVLGLQPGILAKRFPTVYRGAGGLPALEEGPEWSRNEDPSCPVVTGAFCCSRFSGGI
jgi:hypothetical protein